MDLGGDGRGAQRELPLRVDSVNSPVSGLR